MPLAAVTAGVGQPVLRLLARIPQALECDVRRRRLFVRRRTEDRRILREAAPSLRSFDFPFYVGKEWRSVFTFQDNMKGLSWTPVEVFWRVKEYDQVEVPAGKFRAFLIESKPSINWGIRREQVWYAPEVQQLIKRVRERTSAHYEGRGKDTWQLVQYTLK